MIEFAKENPFWAAVIIGTICTTIVQLIRGRRLGDEED
jgi:hypothetical protein